MGTDISSEKSIDPTSNVEKKIGKSVISKIFVCLTDTLYNMYCVISGTLFIFLPEHCTCITTAVCKSVENFS